MWGGDGDDRFPMDAADRSPLHLRFSGGYRTFGGVSEQDVHADMAHIPPYTHRITDRPLLSKEIRSES